MAEHLKEINDIAQNIEVATFENTIEALERSGNTLDKVANVFYNLLGSNTNDDLSKIAFASTEQKKSIEIQKTSDDTAGDRYAALKDLDDMFKSTVMSESKIYPY